MALEVYINDMKVDLKPRAVVALTKQIVDIANFTTIRGDRTNNMTLPDTDNNRKVLQYLNLVGSQSNLPYIKVPAKVIQDGVNIMPNAFAAIDGVEGEFKLSIYAGNLSWATLLEGKTLNDLDYTSDIHVWSAANERATHTTPGMNYLYPIVNYRIDAVAGIPIASILRPWVYFRSLLTKIFNEIGYEVDGDIFTDSKFDGGHLECSKIRYPKEYIIAEAQVQQPIGYVDISHNPFTSTEGWLRFPTEIHDPLEGVSPPGVIEEVSTLFGLRFQYNYRKAGKYFWEIKLHLQHLNAQFGSTVYTSSNPIPYVIKVQTNIGTEIGYFVSGVPTVIQFTTTTPNPLTIEQIFISPPLSYISGGGPNLWSVRIFNDSYIKITDYEGDGMLEFGDTVNLAYMLPDIPQAEFVKAMAYMFGRAIISSPTQKKASFRAWKELSTNRPRAIDWSDKVDEKKPPQITFRLSGWSRNNYFRYKPEEGVPEGYGDGSIQLNDEWLSHSREVITLPFSACINDNAGVPHIPRASIPVGGINYVWSVEGNARVLTSEMDAGTVNIGGVNVSPYRRSWFKDLNGLKNIGFDDSLLYDYYQFIRGLATNPKVVNRNIKLDQLDVVEFDHFVPVFIAKDGAYYFVNKISNWLPDESTKTEFIRL